MITIYTDSFKNNAKVLSFFNSKLYDVKQNSIFMNFEESKAYVSNEIYEGSFSFKYEGEIEKAFYVKTDVFVNLCMIYDTILFDEETKTFFGVNGDIKEEYKIPVSYDEYSYIKYNISEFEKKSLTSSMRENITKSLKFIGSNVIESSLDSVYMYNKNLCTTDKVVFFNASYGDDYEFFNQVNIPSKIAELIGKLREEEISFYVKEDSPYYIIDFSGNFALICPVIDAMNIPKYDTPAFKETYSHKTSVSFDKNKMKDILKFFEPFVKNVLAEKLKMRFDNNNVYIEANGDIVGSRILENAIYDEELESSSFYFSRNIMLDIVSIFKGDIIKNKVSKDSMRYCIESDDNKEIIVITTKVLE